MNDGLVYRRASRAEIGILRLDTFTLQHVDRRHRLAALLVGNSALDNRPMDAASRVLIGLVGHILKTPIDDGFERVKLLLGLSLCRLTASSCRSSFRVPSGDAAARCGALSTVRFAPARGPWLSIPCAPLLP